MRRILRRAPSILVALAVMGGLTSATILAATVIARNGPARVASTHNSGLENSAPVASYTFALGNAGARESFGFVVNQSHARSVKRRTALNPGDTSSFTVTVRVKHTAANYVTFHAKQLIRTTCRQNRLHCHAGVGNGNLARVLKLTIDDLTTGLPIYRGTLQRLPRARRYHLICAVGSTALSGPHCRHRWAVNERHRFRFTVSFPLSGHHDNAYQGTGVKMRFVWMRN